MTEELKENIEFEISQIKKLFTYSEELLKRTKTKELDFIELSALSSFLHSFYTGIENIFEIIAKQYDNNIPTGNKSHKELLKQMAKDTEKRNKIIDIDLYDSLLEYLNFRHFFRHAYDFYLEWDKMEELIENSFITWDKLKNRLKKFIEENN